MNFLAWPDQSIVQPMFVEKSVLPIFPDEPTAAQICATTAPLSGPTVFSIKPWTINHPDSSSAPAADSTTDSADFADFVGAADSTLRPPCLNQRCFVSVSP
jgi:hypothetical protein